VRGDKPSRAAFARWRPDLIGTINASLRNHDGKGGQLINGAPRRGGR
jgi:hypothetical protein